MSQPDEYRLRRILEIGNQLADVVAADAIDEDSILSDFRTQWLITTPLYNIGEQVYALSSDFKRSRPDIPWSAIAGMRHRLVHDYEGTNWNIVAEAVLVEVPRFVEQVRSLLGVD